MNKNKELLPYYQKAKEILSYDPKTGVFYRLKTTNRKFKIGQEAGSVNSKGYTVISITLNNQERKIKAHRLAWYVVYGKLPNIIDHIDGDTFNNSIRNLRSCSQGQNAINAKKRKDNKSSYKGVSWKNSVNKWVAQIQVDKSKKHIGYFDCPQRASEAYEAKAKELFGEFKRNEGEEL